MDTTLIKDATKIDDSTMSIPQPKPDAVQINKNAIVERITNIQSVLDDFNAQMVVQKALLSQADVLGLKTTEEINADLQQQ